jgi:hypothetical protein
VVLAFVSLNIVSDASGVNCNDGTLVLFISEVFEHCCGLLLISSICCTISNLKLYMGLGLWLKW